MAFDEASLLQSRISSREGSTLTVATVAASVSLVLLTLIVPESKATALTYHPGLRLAGCVFALLGMMYRETTIHTIDRLENAHLDELLVARFGRNPFRPEPNPGRFFRSFLYRVLLLSSLIVWIELLFDSFLWFVYYLPQQAPWLRILVRLLQVPPSSGSTFASVVLLSFLLWSVFVSPVYYAIKLSDSKCPLPSALRWLTRVRTCRWRLVWGLWALFAITAVPFVVYALALHLGPSLTFLPFAPPAMIYVLGASFFLTKIEPPHPRN